MGKKLRSLRRLGRAAGAARGIFKRAGVKLRKAPSLPNKGVPVQRPGRGRPAGTLRKPGYVPVNAAPYRPELAAQVPAYGGKKVTGVIDLGGERVISPQISGQGGPTSALPVPGAGSVLSSHVEMHAVSAMRQHNLQEATVYINKAPCSFSSARGANGCMAKLGDILRPGEKLTVYYPPDRVSVFVGR
jgi:hypothetical protein